MIDSSSVNTVLQNFRLAMSRLVDAEIFLIYNCLLKSCPVLMRQPTQLANELIGYLKEIKGDIIGDIKVKHSRGPYSYWSQFFTCRMYQLRGCSINLIVYRTVKYIFMIRSCVVIGSVLGLFKTLLQISYINYDISSWKIDKVLILFH